MKSKLLIALFLVAGVGACAAVQQKVDTALGKVAVVAQAVQPALIPACGAAMAISSMAGPIQPWITAGCATAEAVDKLALDPSSTAWVNGLIGQVETVVNAATGKTS